MAYSPITEMVTRAVKKGDAIDLENHGAAI